MGRELGADLLVEVAFIGMQAAFAGDVLAHDIDHRAQMGAGDMERPHRAAALDQRDDRALVADALAGALGERATASLGFGLAGLRKDAEIGLIGFHNLTLAAHWGKVEAAAPHSFHDAVMKKPCRVVLAAKFTVKLVSREPLFA